MIKKKLPLFFFFSLTITTFAQQLTKDNLPTTSLKLTSSSFNYGKVLLIDSHGIVKTATFSAEDIITKQQFTEQMKSIELLKKELMNEKRSNQSLKKELDDLNKRFQALERKIK